MNLHFTQSVEVGGKCPCGGDTVLLVNFDEFKAYKEGVESDAVDIVEAGIEVTAHQCGACGLIASVSVNLTQDNNCISEQSEPPPSRIHTQGETARPLDVNKTPGTNAGDQQP